MRKYQDSLISSIHLKIEAWFETNDTVEAEEVVRFLHSVKGTAGTIGMSALSESAGQLMELSESVLGSRKSWQTEELRAFLYPFLRQSYEFHQARDVMLTSQSFEELDIPPDQPLVLILDDDVTLLRYLKEKLEANGYFVIATVSPDQAIHYFHDLAPDCFILDVMIPEKDGFEVMETLKGRVKNRFVPTTVISVHNDKETRLKAFRIGADDFLNKPIEMDELLVRMDRQLWRKKQMDRLLFVDDLTGAMNRKYFPEAYRRLCHEKQRTKKNFSIAVIDMDRFKLVNDRYGHLIGDKVLVGFAEFVRQRSRATDSLFRFGGEEFVLLLPQTEEHEAQIFLRRVLLDYSRLEFGSEEMPLRMTFSAGIVEVTDEDPNQYERWVEAADYALYQAKDAGRNRIESSNVPISVPASSRKLNIAVVDDDAIIRTMLTEFISESLGRQAVADIRAFRDGETFLADTRHAERVPYLVILDGMMPGMDGLEVLERLRSKQESDLYSVIMLTGRAEEDDIVRALKLGADDYLTKPFRIKELDARIKRLLRRIH